MAAESTTQSGEKHPFSFCKFINLIITSIDGIGNSPSPGVPKEQVEESLRP